MLEHSIDINNLSCNPLVLKKKLVKPLKNSFLRLTLHTKEVIIGHAYGQNDEKTFFTKKKKKKKKDQQLSEIFYFIKTS